MIDLRLRHPDKPVLNPDRIAVMIPTRGRPAMLGETISSFLIATRRPELVSFWIAVDDDDRTTQDYIDRVDVNSLPFSLNWVVLPRQPTLAMTWNLLWQAVYDGPGFYLGFIDDYLMLTQGWDDAVRDVLSQTPNRLGLGQIPDSFQKNPDTLTIICGTAEWFNKLGYFVPPYFPFWFADTWLDQVATAAGLKFRLPLDVAPQGDAPPGTHRMRELGFWYKAFCAMTEERLDSAKQLALAAYAGDIPWYAERESLVRQANETLLKRVQEQPEAIAEMEAFFAGKSPWSKHDEDRYHAVKSAVIDYLGPAFKP